MNYNEYDSRGNKKKFNLSDIFTDKTKKARVILLLYLILFVALIVFVRTSDTKRNNTTNTDNTNKVEENENTNNNDNENNNVEENNGMDEEFSYLLLNNYNFSFKVTVNDDIYELVGKRYNDKYDFNLSGEENAHYIGTVDSIYEKNENDDEYSESMFPVPVLDYFDNDLLKKIVTAASLTETENVYEISNYDLNMILTGDSEYAKDTEKMNTIKLKVMNNKIVGIDIEFSNLGNEWNEENITAEVELDYSNFGLVDDFSVNIE